MKDNGGYFCGKCAHWMTLTKRDEGVLGVCTNKPLEAAGKHWVCLRAATSAVCEHYSPDQVESICLH